MIKKYLSLVLVVLLTNVLMAVPALAQSQSNAQAQSAEKIKIKIAKLGVGEKARATVHLKDGTKIKGYVTEAHDNDFMIRDRQSNEAHTIAYQDVVKVEKNGGHSLARNLALGIAIGAGAIVAIVAILIVRSD